MTPFSRLTRRLCERLVGTFYEGPEAPARLGEMVIAFANDTPHATRSEWVTFAKFHAEECYRSGFTRGAEWAERDYESRMPGVTPEEVANVETPDWPWSPNIMLLGNDDVVFEVNDEEKLAAEHQQRYEKLVMDRNRRRP